jgi:hypothetical protein
MIGDLVRCIFIFSSYDLYRLLDPVPGPLPPIPPPPGTPSDFVLRN